jgi:hypothetical protein
MSLFSRHKKFEEKLFEQLGDMEVKPSASLWDRIDSGITGDSFENGVQTGLENFEQMPYPETWDKIAAELPEAKVSNRFARYYIGVALVVLFSVGIYIGKNWQPQPAVRTQPKQPKQRLANASDQSEQLAIAKIQTPSQPVEAGKMINNESGNNGSGTSPAVRSIPPAGVTPLSAAGEKGLPVLSATPITRVPNKVTKAEKVKSTAEQKTIVAANTAFPTNTTIQNEAKGNSADEEDIAGRLQTPTAASDPSGNNNHPKETVIPAIPLFVQGQSDSNTVQVVTPAFEQPKEMAAVKPDSSLYAQKAQEYNTRSNDEELTPVSISVLVGAHVSFTTYDAPKEAGSLNFERNIELRKELERPTVDWSGGFLVDYRLNKKWMLSSGVMMVNFKQKFEYTIEKALDPAVNNEVGAPTSNPGDSFVVGNDYSNQIRYSWTEIPLYVNYTITNKGKWNLDMQAGVSYAFINTIDGGMIGYDNKGVLLLKDKTSFPGIQNTVYITAMPQLSYQFAPSVAVGFVPTVKYSLTSIVGNDRWIQQHPYFIGLNICLRKRF